MIPAFDIPPTGTVRTEYYTLHNYAPDNKEESFLFNTKEYLKLEGSSGDIARHDFICQFQRRFYQLMFKFMKRWTLEQRIFIDIPEKDVLFTSSLLTAIIVATNPKQVTVDITPDATIFYTVIYPNKNAYFEIHFSAGEETELVFNIYRNDVPAHAYGGEFKQSLNQYIRYFFEK